MQASQTHGGRIRSRSTRTARERFLGTSPRASTSYSESGAAFRHSGDPPQAVGSNSQLAEKISQSAVTYGGEKDTAPLSREYQKGRTNPPRKSKNTRKQPKSPRDSSPDAPLADSEDVLMTDAMYSRKRDRVSNDACPSISMYLRARNELDDVSLIVNNLLLEAKILPVLVGLLGSARSY